LSKGRDLTRGLRGRAMAGAPSDPDDVTLMT
jgi:hypothetical protein